MAGIWALSVALGWHYAIDGIVGAAGALASHWGCRSWLRWRQRAEVRLPEIAITAQGFPAAVVRGTFFLAELKGGRLDDISTRRALTWPALLTLVMLAIAAAISLHTQVSGWRVFAPYVGAWASATLLSALIWIFIQVAMLLPTRADRPLQTVLQRVGEPLRLALLPALIFPIFLGAYTWAKVSIPFAVGYGWERTWVDADHLIFGMDAWRWAHAMLPEALAPALTFYYAVVWGFALVFSGTLISSFASRRFAATYFTALMLSWLIGGIGMAYAISAAGPIFAHLTDTILAARFAPLQTELLRLVGPDDLVMKSQRYLAAGMNMKIALKGGGVSAMPSMHMATCTLLVMAAWKTRWLWLASLFWLLTFFGSVYLGYHYAVDAPAAVAIAVPCWMLARRIHMPLSRSANNAMPIPAAQSVA